jgi:flagellar motor switch protein FliM
MTAELYDFRKPGRLEGPLEQRMTAWLRSFTKRAPERWSREIPFRIELELHNLETVQSRVALSRAAETAIGYRVELGSGTTLLVLPRPLVMLFTAGLVGDPGEALPADRELTAVEESLADYVLESMLLAALREAWPGQEPIKLQLGPKEQNLKYSRAFAPDLSVAFVPFSVRGPFGEQQWQWLMPHKALLDTFALPKEPAWDAAQELAARQRMEVLVKELPIEFSVGLGDANVPLSALASLQIGDVLVLNQRVSEPLFARVAGDKKFRVWPGRVNLQQAVQVESLQED